MLEVVSYGVWRVFDCNFRLLDMGYIKKFWQRYNLTMEPSNSTIIQSFKSSPSGREKETLVVPKSTRSGKTVLNNVDVVVKSRTLTYNLILTLL